MIHYLIAERYAKGLNAAITQTDQLEQAVTDLRTLGELYASEHALNTVLSNPVIDLAKRTRVLDEVLQRLACSQYVANLAHVLLRRRRIALLPDVATVFATLVNARLGRVKAVVTTARKLSDAEEARIRTSLETFSGKEVRMQWETEPAVLGGATARIGGLVIDGSLRTRLEHIRDKLVSEET